MRNWTAGVGLQSNFSYVYNCIFIEFCFNY